MRVLAALVALVACSGTNATLPVRARAPNEAWQAFEVGPFRSSFSGYTRASWPVDVAEPQWVELTFAGLAIASYDGKELRGEVDLWAGAGLDPMRCAAEVIWDMHDQHGVRIEMPTQVQPGAYGGRHAFWSFTAHPARAPIVAATAFVFCPIDDAHRKPPWGTSFHSIEQIAAGPDAKRAYCARVASDPHRSVAFELAGHRTMQVGFACGVLPRLRGRDVIDACRGDVLLSLDALGRATIAASTTAGPDDNELRHYMAGDTECARLTLTGFDPKAQRAWDAAVAYAGTRITCVMSRDGMIQP